MMASNPYRKAFIKLALITSPLFGLFGGAPLFVFNHYLITPAFYLITTISLALWTSNILLFEIIRTPGLTEQKRERNIRIVLSCLITLLLHYFIMLWFDKFGPPAPPHHHEGESHFHIHHGPRRVSMVQPLIFGFTFNIIQLIIIDLIQLRADKLNIENELNQLRAFEMEARHNNLIEQLNPHFLFNSLNTLKTFIGNEPEKAKAYLIRLSNFLRKSITDQSNIISLQQELQLCSDYMELQKMRFPLSILTDISLANLNIASINVPRYSIQTLLENAIKHNVVSEDTPLKIIITGNNNSVTVKNSVNKKFEQEADAGTGLHNLDMRYQLLSGKNIRIESNDQWFSVTIPLLSN